MKILNKESIQTLGNQTQIPVQRIDKQSATKIVHIGIGGFHRSHQAYSIARLLDIDAEKYGCWRIIGVGLMPNDLTLVRDFRNQDNLYVLRMIGADQKEEIKVIDAISEMLHAQGDAVKIVECIGRVETSVVSFTITEGGYNVDFEDNYFKIETPAVQADLLDKMNPKTAFGFLAKGLAIRMATHGKGVTLLSCDNIIGNGDILKLAMLSFLESYDPSLKSWVESQVSFPNSMVDRITPVSSEADKANFQDRFGVRDNCLVVSEDYFQWVIEKENLGEDFPPLDLVGVEFVEHVKAYETMKLGILNAGHTLVGLLGDLLGYDKIHAAVGDVIIASLYEKFSKEEVIPMLKEIQGVSYITYFEKVKSRFGNAMINDSTDRIISGSSDKFPKFVLPIIQQQLATSTASITCSAIIAAAWWAYLTKRFNADHMATVQDGLVDTWKYIFADSTHSADLFLAYPPVFSELSQDSLFRTAYMDAVEAFRMGKTRDFLIQKINKV